MTSIVKAAIKDAELLSKIGTQSFIESHGISASKKDIENYLESKFTKEAFDAELTDSNNIFHILYYNKKPVGYSKIIYNVIQHNIPFENVTKLERLYVLEVFHHLRLGLELFLFNIELSKKNNQKGMWLYTWIENHKAIQFYKKVGFKIVGSYDFKISETHSNPNHQMLLTF